MYSTNVRRPYTLREENVSYASSVPPPLHWLPWVEKSLRNVFSSPREGYPMIQWKYILTICVTRLLQLLSLAIVRFRLELELEFCVQFLFSFEPNMAQLSNFPRRIHGTTRRLPLCFQLIKSLREHFPNFSQFYVRARFDNDLITTSKRMLLFPKSLLSPDRIHH